MTTDPTMSDLPADDSPRADAPASGALDRITGATSGIPLPFAADESPRSVAGNAPLVLDDPQAAWIVESGRVDVFAVACVDGRPAGPRQHLFEVGAGGLLLGNGACVDRLRMIAVGRPGTTVRRVSVERLRGFAADPACGAHVAALLDGWIERLTEGIRPGPLPRALQSLTPGKPLRLKADALVSPPRLAWIASGAVTGRFLGTTTISLDEAAGLFPLAPSGWVQVDAALVLASTPTVELLGDERLWSSLDRFHALVADGIAARAVALAEQERGRLRRKVDEERRRTSESLSALASALCTDRVVAAVGEPGEDPLLAACRLVAARQGIAIEAPRSAGAKRLSEPVAAIARASGIRTRRVALAGCWWTEDAGPLLGFRVDGDVPVALLPTAGGYEVVDPATGRRVSVDDSVRAGLRGFAHCFYRSFPAVRLTPGKIFRFGLPGTARDWIAVVVLGVAGALLGLFVPVATGWIVGDVIPGAERRELLLLVLALVVATAASTLFEFVQGLAVLRIETRMDSSVEAGLWDRLLALPVSFFRGYMSGDLAMRAMGVSAIRQIVTGAALSSLLSFVFSIVAFGMLFRYSPGLALVACGMFAVVLAATALAVWIQLPLERRQHEAAGRVSGIVLQLLSGISRLRVAGAENRALAHWAANHGRQVALAYRSQSVSNDLATFLGAVPVLATVVLYGSVARLGEEGLGLGAFLAFAAAFAQVLSAATTMGGTVSTVLDVVPLWERALPILETLPEVHRAKRDPGELGGGVEISHVSFRYGEGDPLVLEDVSLSIRPGEFVAFVGPSGAGKSTILRLLLGFETPVGGSILYDREDLAHLDLQAVRRQIGTVLQNGRLVAGDIFRNIVGSAPLTLEDAWEAARLAGLEKDVKAMPMGMHTVLSDGESTLSGGQRQRLMIARAIVSKPKILLFDEATSALDNVTQRQVSQSLEALKATRIVVAHRLSTIANADRIFVVERGRIVQQGTYAELLARPGTFADLARRQLL